MNVALCLREHSISVLLGLVYFTECNGLQLGLFCCQWQNFILLMAEQYCMEQIHLSFFVHVSLDEHVGFHVHYFGSCQLYKVTLSYANFTFFGYAVRSGIAGSYGRSIFSCLNTLPADFIVAGLASTQWSQVEASTFLPFT